MKSENLKLYQPRSSRGGWYLILAIGYCLFRVKYPNDGWIRMYSRSVLRDIVVIETDQEKYGITPVDPELFMADLEKRIVKSKKID